MEEKNKLPKEKKKTKEEIWRESLFSGNEQVVRETIKVIREEGNTKIFDDLLKFYQQNRHTELGKKVYELICDIKDSKLVPKIFEAIKSPKYQDIKKELISVCWQSRLDYSDYIYEFAQMFLDEDLEIAFEVFTVIEYFEKKLNKEKAQRAISLLKDNFQKVEKNKLELLLDLVHIIEKKADL